MPQATRPGQTLTAICAAMPLDGTVAGTAPEWIHVLPMGEIPTVDGRGPYRTGDLASIATASLEAAGGRLPIDENHAIDLAAKAGGASPARGWIVALEPRENGLWGRVEWSEAGKALMAERAYRFLSPVIVHLADMTIVAVRRASLTNKPNMRQLVALNQETGMDLTKLREAMGLDDKADETAIVAAVAKLKTDTATALQSQGAAIGEALGPVAVAIGLQAEATPEEVLAKAKALADPAKMVPVEQVVALQTELATVSKGIATDKAVAVVDAAIAAGKPGVKPMRDYYIARHMADPKATEEALAALPSLTGNSAARRVAPDKDGKVALGADELHAVQLMGVDPEAYAKTKAAEAAVNEEAL